MLDVLKIRVRTKTASPIGAGRVDKTIFIPLDTILYLVQNKQDEYTIHFKQGLAPADVHQHDFILEAKDNALNVLNKDSRYL